MRYALGIFQVNLDQSASPPQLSGYQLEMFYRTLRGVGGDYFDIIDLPDGRTLIAVADVSGKGMPAALLAANIQALVRSITSQGGEVALLAGEINRHLRACSPEDRFATGIFVVLSRNSGELTYVNAGHNAPILASSCFVNLSRIHRYAARTF